MNEDFVTYELAIKLKEKGFKEECIAYYWEKINEHTPSFVVEDNMPEDGLSLLDLLSNHNQAEWSPFIDAPTIPQVLKWLRKEKKIHIMIDIWKVDVNDTNYKWGYDIVNLTTTKVDGCDTQCADTYEQAALAGIEYCLDNLI